MRAVCRQQVAWRRAGLPATRIAVNVAARQIQRRDLADTFRQILAETRAEPERLEIELTESSIQKDPDLAGKTLKQFADMGFGIALDDFGTGYSSLTHLRSFPVTKIKIDRSFVANLSTHSDDAAIVKAVISMAHSLRIQTLAEGVETAEQLAFLRNHQCDAMQGFYFSKPVAAEEVTAELFARGLYDLDEADEDDGKSRSLPASA